VIRCSLIVGLRCDPEIETGNQATIFNDFYLDFIDDVANAKWNSSFAPYCYNKKCAEYVGVPEYVSCDVQPPDGFERLCLCKKKSMKSFVFEEHFFPRPQFFSNLLKK